MRAARLYSISLAVCLIAWLGGCGARQSEISGLSPADKIERAVAIIGTLEPGGYCAQVPDLREVVRNPSCCAISRRVSDYSRETFVPDERGTIVDIHYDCRGPDGMAYIAGQSVDLEAGVAAPDYPDVRGRRFLGTVASDTFP